ncbi:annulin-like [Oppia nitens]|uniref:annulin-like n=1 Tax=Oppia nitens TaxID=1686743 RepID=UPI0023D9BF2D|nr:annulin-like [Oppia nitens]
MFSRNRYRIGRIRCDRMGNCFAWLRPTRVRFPPPSRYGFDNRVVPEIKSDALVLRKTDFLIESNSWEHRTEKYSVTKRDYNQRLVIRRGSLFELKFTFQRQYNRLNDVINLVFTVKDAKRGEFTKETQIVVPVFDDRNTSNLSIVLEDEWIARIIKVEGFNVSIEISSSSSAIIGEYNLSVETKSLRHEVFLPNPVIESFYILFNPWNKRDSVFLKDRDAREEYVLSESGIIWRGTHELLKPTPWHFAQFDDLVLEASLYALSKVGRLNVVDRGDPVKVCRHISAIVNSVDDNGIVVGNWKEDFRGGTAPTDWHGSQAILSQFYKNKRPVKYGQCWVFSGVCATVCRAIGIPCRVITCYQSAHDTHSSITVDRFFDEEGEPIKSLNTDSIWNFHSWDEVWIKRPDLSMSGAYDGWNVIDSTPQEPSDGLYRCGPTSVVSVKKGEVERPYDAKFVYSEVNADEVYWLYFGHKQPVKFLTHYTDSIGIKISTKAILRNTRVDITDNYKHKEKSAEERETMIRALRMARNQYSRYYLNEKFEDIRFEFSLIDDVVIGQPFTVRLKMYNKSNKVYTVNAIVGIRSTSYTGVTRSIVKKDRQELQVGPQTEEELIIVVTYSEYEKHLLDQSIFNITVMANVLETDFQYYAMDDFRLRMPDIKIETIGDIIQGKPFTCNVFFRNPLPKSLTNGVFTIEGPDYSNRLRYPLKTPIFPDTEARATFRLVPKTSGERTISAKFMSNELRDVDGFKSIKVSANMT